MRPRSPTSRRGWVALFPAVLVAHAAATYLAGLAMVYRLSITGNLNFFGDYLLSLFFSLLMLPIGGLLLDTDLFTGVWDSVPILLNSALWATGICLLVLWAGSGRALPSNAGDG
jgi:hypothetical protein